MAEAGHSDLSTMDGGFHGAYDRAGELVQAGWATEGFEQSSTATEGRDWGSLGGRSG